jgi:vanillate O-demethylase ferredoxin subunit
MLDRILTVRVDRITRQTADVQSFEFVHPAGRALPGYSPGAHIDVHLPGGFMRPYSLARAADGAVVSRYVIGVKREPASRGGSAALHERVRVGDLLAIGTPRNTFELRADAAQVLLLAGGIGLTPLLAMAQQLVRAGRAVTLCVFARSRAHLAFADDLAALGAAVRLHFDDPAAPEKLELPALLARPQRDRHVYLCGPAGFMRAALDAAAAAGWPDEQLHLEYFAPPDGDAQAGVDEPFVLKLARRGIEVPVAADQSAVDALHDLGIDVPTSCQQGVCGTCVVGWSADGAGEPEHRDHCLSVTERRSKVALCCSRAKAGHLAIDL